MGSVEEGVRFGIGLEVEETGGWDEVIVPSKWEREEEGELFMDDDWEKVRSKMAEVDGCMAKPEVAEEPTNYKEENGENIKFVADKLEVLNDSRKE